MGGIEAGAKPCERGNLLTEASPMNCLFSRRCDSISRGGERGWDGPISRRVNVVEVS